MSKLSENFRSLSDVWEFLRVAARLGAAQYLKARLPVPELLRRFTPPVRVEHRGAGRAPLPGG